MVTVWILLCEVVGQTVLDVVGTGRNCTAGDLVRGLVGWCGDGVWEVGNGSDGRKGGRAGAGTMRS